MATFELQIKGMDKLLSGASKMGEALPASFQRAMVASVIAIKQDAQSLVPVKTGALKTAITEMVQNNPLVGIVSVGPTANYGKFVEFGTRPHVIEPINGKALAFTSGGSRYVVKRVNHPGTRAQPFMEPAFEHSKATVEDNFRRAVDAALNQSFS